MPDLPAKKVGIISCSGEELPEGTVSRLAALKVLEQLRPSETVTICLPLFLAGGEGDRAFAKFYPTIAIDGCDKRCAARGTEMYSGKPAASIVVTDIVGENGLGKLEGKRRLNAVGQQAVDGTAGRVAGLVDELLHIRWDRTTGAPEETVPAEPNAVQAECSCATGIPSQAIEVNGRAVNLVALPLIFRQFRDSGRQPSPATTRELLESVRVYNQIPPGEDEQYLAVLLQEYTAFCEKGAAG